MYSYRNVIPDTCIIIEIIFIYGILYNQLTFSKYYNVMKYYVLYKITVEIMVPFSSCKRNSCVILFTKRKYLSVRAFLRHTPYELRTQFGSRILSKMRSILP